MKGTFAARAQEWALGVSQGGNEQVAVLFRIIGGEHDGQCLTWFGHFTEKTLDRTLDSLRHCGWASDSIAELDGLDANEVQIVVDEEEYEGKLRTRIKWVNRPSRLALKEQMTPDAAKAFAARLRGKTIAHRQKYGAQPASTSTRQSTQSQNGSRFGGSGEPAPGATDYDDDIPF